MNETYFDQDNSKCMYEVFRLMSWANVQGPRPPNVYVGSQCSRKQGHGEDGLYCKQHAKMMEQEYDPN
ncbi:hypothetical protein LCGC14_1675820 [marine sediment metagenome]|uniref:Uncharacterized protein n=1 Tax=marine sediment metagenome TaxID=412755 RepID=A0A0F9HQQ4_9ZZZZ